MTKLRPHNMRNLSYILKIQVESILYFLNLMRKEERSINRPNQFSTVCLVLVWTLLNLGALSLTAFSAMAAGDPIESTFVKDPLIPLIVQLEQTLHFHAPDGQSVAVWPDMYLVEPVNQGEPHLALWHNHGTIIIPASRTTYDQRVERPEAYLTREENSKDFHHLVVFLPDGTALEAVGSVSGIQTRGDFRVTRHYQLDTATGVIRFGDGQQGRRLSTDQPDISAQYREKSGSRGNELSMIQLQSVISQRQMAVQLTTSLLNKLHGQFQLEEATDRPGDDYARHIEESPESCRMRCAGDGNCQAFTFVKPNPGAAQGQCFLKRSEPQPVANHCCVSGTRSSTQDKIIRNIGR